IKGLKAHTWYEGSIKDLPVWLYISYYDGNYMRALYGYESVKGANIEITGNIKNDSITLSFMLPQKNQKSEYFKGVVTNDVLKGKWISGDKSLDFEFKPIHNEIPQNTTEFVEAFENLSVPFKVDSYGAEVFMSADLLRKYYKNRKFNRFIPNLRDFIKDNESFKLADGDAILIGKVSLDKKRYLLLYSANLLKEYVISHDAYALKNTGMLFASIVDEKANILASKTLGNTAEDAYYMDFGFEISSKNQIKLIWTSYMRDGGARIEEGKEEEVIKVKETRFE
ncbi:MAG: hypothetical protein SFU27_11520, partial [Thermonemataceae bacterium]|nr:hypothetical protein [Thermonemataceae bacterium]